MRGKKSRAADLGHQSQKTVENGRPAHEQTNLHIHDQADQPDHEYVIVDFLQEANTLLDEIGRFQRAFRQADVSNMGDAAERLYGTILWAEALLQNAAGLIRVGTTHNWGYLLLRSHAQMARQILSHSSIPAEIAERLRSWGVHKPV